MPSSAPRTSCYSEDVRWLIVFKHLMGKTHAKIRRDLSVVDEHGHEWIPGPCGRTIDRILERFKETGDVKTHMGKRAAPPQNAALVSARGECDGICSSLVISCAVDAQEGGARVDFLR